ncbi:MAG: hypothetical protein ACSHX8_09395 [Opitutaceae bacterium]
MKLFPTLLPFTVLIILSGCSETTQKNTTTTTNEPATPIAAVRLPSVEQSIPKQPIVEADVKPSVEYNFPGRASRVLKERFIENDVNQDGQLSLEEFTSYLSVWLEQNQPGKDAAVVAPAPFLKKDINGDGFLSPQEAF